MVPLRLSLLLTILIALKVSCTLIERYNDIFNIFQYILYFNIFHNKTRKKKRGRYDTSFIFQEELRICVLPTHLSYDAPWPVRKVPLRCTPHFVTYHLESKTYCVITSTAEPLKSYYRFNGEDKVLTKIYYLFNFPEYLLISRY